MAVVTDSLRYRSSGRHQRADPLMHKARHVKGTDKAAGCDQWALALGNLSEGPLLALVRRGHPRATSELVTTSAHHGGNCIATKKRA
jgi:hypothetical protein